MPSDFDDESIVFDDAFVAGGIKESSLRRHVAPPARVAGRPVGPRDWTPPTRRRRRWPLLAVAAAVAAFVAVISLRHSSASDPVPIAAPTSTPTPTGNSSATEPQVRGMADLSIGDCFSVVGSGAQQIVQPHGCTQRHTDQLVRLERAAGDDDRFPPDSYWNGPVAKRCEQDVAAFTGLTADRWPLHFAANQFHPVRTGWASGDRTVYCVAEWLRGGGVGTARQLTPRPPQAAITAPDDRTITGVLAELRHGPNSCLALDAGGRRTAIASVDGTYTSGFTTVDGVLDRVHSGLFRGVSTSAALPVRRIGDTVRLTGYFDTDTTGVECGAHTVFRFTGVR